MIHFIWRSWKRHKERLILLLVGALIISAGLSYLVGTTQNSKGTVVSILKKNWQSQYDILVRPKGSQFLSEKNKLLPPNYLSGLHGGISIKQYNIIKKMNDIKVAAPLAPIGYTYFVATLKPFENIKTNPNKIYRIEEKIKNNKGYKQLKKEKDYYFTSDQNIINKHKKIFSNDLSIKITGYLLLAGIDPQQEAALSGLNQATLNDGASHYFLKSDQVSVSSIPMDKKKGVPPQLHISMPVLISKTNYQDMTYQYTLQETNISGKSLSEKNKSFRKNLQQSTYKSLEKKEYKKATIYSGLINHLAGKSYSKDKELSQAQISLSGILGFKTSPLHYKLDKSPFPKRWHYSYDITPSKNQSLPTPYSSDLSGGFRKVIPVNNWSKQHFYDKKIFINPQFVGFYSPSKLKISTNPLTKLPMETYRPPSAKVVLDDHNLPVNPPVTIYPDGKPNSFLLEPPTMLTTIKAAKAILGNQPISAIRIKVNNVDTFSPKNEKKLKEIARKIERQTGLSAKVTLGSSPEPVLLHVPASGQSKELGWMEMPWIKLDSTSAIYKETQIGFSGIIAIVMISAIAYVLATNLVSFLARKKEFAILTALGWKQSQLRKLVFLEALLIGGFVALISVIVQIIFLIDGRHTSIGQIILTAFLSLFIYILGSAGPLIMIGRINIIDTLKRGEVSNRRLRLLQLRGITGLIVNNIAGRIYRNSLSLLAVVFHTSLIAFFLFITLRLKSVLYTSWLGQYTALQIGPADYVAMIIAVLTTAEIMWQNVVERKQEISLLKALGWRNGPVRFHIMLEGIVLGLLAGIISIGVSLMFIWFFYHQLPLKKFYVLLPIGFLPVIVCVLGALIPAEKAVQYNPSFGIRDSR